MNAPAFDVRAYMRDPYVLRPTDLDLEELDTLSAPALELLGYLWAVESNALTRMRDLLVTPTHAESRVTAFLSTWAHEQRWLGATLQALLSANGRTAQEPADTALGRLRRTWDDRCGPTVAAIGTNLLNVDITGAHMITEWLDSAVLTVAYQWLGRAEPALEDLTGKVCRLKDRHRAFDAAEACARLADPATGRIARFAIHRWRFPGTRYAGPAPHRIVAAGFLGDSGARHTLEGLDRVVATFPGLSGTHPVATALARLEGRTRTGRYPGLPRRSTIP